MNGTQHALIADFVFDGTALRRSAAVVMDGPKITGVLPASDLSRSIPTRSLPDGTWLAPGFIDVQVNGGGDVLFNDRPTVEGIRAIAAAHRRFGTTSLLPTLISDTPEKTQLALSAVSELVGRDPSILGIHLEGPFLSPEKPGVHSLQYIREPTPEDEQALMRPNSGVKVLTLAPERVPEGVDWPPRRRRLSDLPRSLRRDLRASQSGDIGRAHRFHASVQCHATAREP